MVSNLEISVLGLASDKEKQLTNKKIETLYDIVRYTPNKYFNLNQKNKPISAITTNDEGQVLEIVGIMSNIKEDGFTKRVSATIDDGTGKATITWFNQPYLARRLHEGSTYSVVGKIAFFYGHVSIQSPIFYSDDPRNMHQIIPQYTKIRGMSPDYFKACVYKAQECLSIMGTDYLTDEQKEKLNTISDIEFVSKTHFPKNSKDIQAAGRRYIIDNLFPFAAHMAYKQRFSGEHSKYFITKTNAMNDFISSLSFELTDDQSKTIKMLTEKMQHREVVDALIQGDVGCGKTIVAISLAIAMKENGYQTAIMAPTNVLAEQHYTELTKYGLDPVLVTGGMKAKEKKVVLEKIASGEAKIIIGTHALISDGVQYQSLGLVIVDEEHRFGVSQREKLAEKAAIDGIHKISMSATPIPRSLAMAIYGKNTTLVDIHTMPSGRKPVVTCTCHTASKLYNSIRNQVEQGRQAYIVCPFIEDGTTENTKDIVSADSCYDDITMAMKAFPEIHIGKITGKMKQSEIDKVIEQFVNNEIQILISTTIVEVGVNVPNATVMAIQNSERFGLAQLHQLRGRVGRGNYQSYCVLMTAPGNESNQRIAAMLSTTDGFKIAEEDANLRGIGDIAGDEQSGFTKIMALVSAYPNIYKQIQSVIESEQRTEKDWQELFETIDSIRFLTRANFADVCHCKDI